MSLPQVPTDNLYKFMAITGLLMVGFTIVGIEILLNRYSNNSIDLSYEIELLNNNQKRVKEDLEAFDRLLVEGDSIVFPPYDKIKNRSHKIGGGPLAIDYMLNSKIYDSAINVEALKGIKEFYLLVYEIEEESIEIDYKTSKLDKNRLDYRLSLIFGSVLIAAGLFLTIKGFRLWYLRNQKYIDEKLKNESQIE